MAANPGKNVFLTGASSGIGRATAELLMASGFTVWATSRSKERLTPDTHLHALSMDLESPASIDTAWHQALDEAGRIDLLIQNAGAGIFGALEDVTLEEAARQWQILVAGPLQLFRRGAAHMRSRSGGTIVGVSSLAAELPLPFAAHYSAGKAALSALLGGLDMELRPFGVRVIDLRPGDLRTEFNDLLDPALPADSPYLPWATAAWKESCALMNRAPGPELAARAILRAIAPDRAGGVVRCGTFFQARLGALGARFLPRRFLLRSIRDYFHLNPIDRQQRP
jgi:NAD(P)-dependent dehydrogenase (short-subunit alcohol dehydrogenase family)